MQTAITNKFRPISLRGHGVMDYVFALLLGFGPWFFGFAQEEPARDMAVAIAVMVICYTVATDYELGLVQLLPFRAHLWMDLLVGLALLIAPSWMPISNTARIVLTCFGAVALVVTTLTRRPRPNVPS
jgi:hypothetical protein